MPTNRTLQDEEAIQQKSLDVRGFMGRLKLKQKYKLKPLQDKLKKNEHTNKKQLTCMNFADAIATYCCQATRFDLLTLEQNESTNLQQLAPYEEVLKTIDRFLDAILNNLDQVAKRFDNFLETHVPPPEFFSSTTAWCGVGGGVVGAFAGWAEFTSAKAAAEAAAAAGTEAAAVSIAGYEISAGSAAFLGGVGGVIVGLFIVGYGYYRYEKWSHETLLKQRELARKLAQREVSELDTTTMTELASVLNQHFLNKKKQDGHSEMSEVPPQIVVPSDKKQDDDDTAAPDSSTGNASSSTPPKKVCQEKGNSGLDLDSFDIVDAVSRITGDDDGKTTARS